ncbi:hypothetical protein ACNHUS_06200 [Actinomycetes bacterium M1A6_2h]
MIAIHLPTAGSPADHRHVSETMHTVSAEHSDALTLPMSVAMWLAVTELLVATAVIWRVTRFTGTGDWLRPEHPVPT